MTEISPLKDANRAEMPFGKLRELSPSRIADKADKPAKEADLEGISKPPGRISPFKGAKAQLTPHEIFATTPRRVLNGRVAHHRQPGAAGAAANQTQSCDRLEPTQFGSAGPGTARAAAHTPSRIIKGRKYISSEQPISKLRRMDDSAASSDINLNVNRNLLNQFKEKKLKPCLKPAPVLKLPELLEAPLALKARNESDNDLKTSLNTLENAKNTAPACPGPADKPGLQATKKRRAVTFDPEVAAPEQNTIADVVGLLQQILRNQETILQRLDRLEQQR